MQTPTFEPLFPISSRLNRVAHWLKILFVAQGAVQLFVTVLSLQAISLTQSLGQSAMSFAALIPGLIFAGAILTAQFFAVRLALREIPNANGRAQVATLAACFLGLFGGIAALAILPIIWNLIPDSVREQARLLIKPEAPSKP
jgi:hypothetical protein